VKNNIPSIGVTYGYGEINELCEATFVSHNVEDIIGYVNQIELFYTISERCIGKGKKIIGINGVDTSGKTEFTFAYSKFLSSLKVKNAVIHIDDYHNPTELRNNGLNKVDAYYNNAFNYDQIIKEVLSPLAEFGFIDKDILCLNVDTDKYENLIHYDMDADTVVLIEGVLLFRKPLFQYFDATVFLHIEFEEVLKRARIRDVPKYGEAFLEKYIHKYIPIQKRYLEECKPRKKSDMVIDNQDYYIPKLLSN